MFAMVLSSTTISWATQISTSAQVAWEGPFTGPWSTTASGRSVSSVMGVGSLSMGGRERSADGRTGDASGRQDDLVDDALHELLGGALADEEEPMQHDPGQGRGQQLDVHVRTDLAALLGALEERLGAGQLGGEHLVAERLGELGVAGDRGEDRAEGVDLGLVGQPTVAAEGRDQVTAQGAGVDHALLGEVVLPGVVLERVDDQLDLAVPAAVEGGLCGLGLRGPPVHREPVVADLGEHRERGFEDLGLARPLDSRAAVGLDLGGHYGSAPWFTRMKRNGFVSSRTRVARRTIPAKTNFWNRSGPLVLAATSR